MTHHQPEQHKNDFPDGLAAPARRALAGASYSRLDQLTLVSEADLKKLHGMGPKAIGVLREALAARGLSFAGARHQPTGPRGPLAPGRKTAAASGEQQRRHERHPVTLLSTQIEPAVSKGNKKRRTQ